METKLLNVPMLAATPISASQADALLMLVNARAIEQYQTSLEAFTLWSQEIPRVAHQLRLQGHKLWHINAGFPSQIYTEWQPEKFQDAGLLNYLREEIDNVLDTHINVLSYNLTQPVPPKDEVAERKYTLNKFKQSLYNRNFTALSLVCGYLYSYVLFDDMVYRYYHRHVKPVLHCWEQPVDLLFAIDTLGIPISYRR